MTIKEYLEHAQECDHLAATADLESTKIAMQDTARTWRTLAVHQSGGRANTNRLTQDA